MSVTGGELNQEKQSTPMELTNESTSETNPKTTGDSGDADATKHERSALHLLFEQTLAKLTEDGKSESPHPNERHFFSTLRNMTKFTQNDKIQKPEKVACGSCQKSQSINEKITYELMELQGRWNDKVGECQALKEENQHLKEWIKLAKSEDSDNKELEVSDPKNRQLEQAVFEKAEIQKQMLEEAEERCRNMEEKLSVERKLRERREAEIAHLHSNIYRNEQYNRKQGEEKEDYIKKIEAIHKQQMDVLGGIINRKNEELTHVNEKYNKVHDIHKQEVKGLDKSQMLKEIKLKDLEESLELKTRHLRESYLEIYKLQEGLRAKRQELEDLTLKKTSIKHPVKEQLKAVKQQLSEIVNTLDFEDSSRSSKDEHKDATTTNQTEENRNEPSCEEKVEDKLDIA